MNLNTTAAGIHAPSIKFSSTLEGEAKEIFVIGRRASLAVSNIVNVTSSNDEKIIDALLNSIKDSGSATTFLSDGRKLAVIMLPAAEKICRNNHIFSPHTITASLDALGLATSARRHCCQIVVMDSQIEDFACPAAAALARSMPLYHSKSDLEDIAASSGVSVSFHDENTTVLDPESSLWQTAAAVCDGIRLAAQLGDMPPAELSPDTYAHKCHEIATGLGVTCSEIKGDDLRKKGYGGKTLTQFHSRSVLVS
jgi:leucyl aminopeptidase